MLVLAARMMVWSSTWWSVVRLHSGSTESTRQLVAGHLCSRSLAFGPISGLSSGVTIPALPDVHNPGILHVV